MARMDQNGLGCYSFIDGCTAQPVLSLQYEEADVSRANSSDLEMAIRTHPLCTDLVYRSRWSIIDRFPLEIAALVFKLYAQQSSALTLGAVCKKWRDFAWSTPELWATMIIDVDRLRRAKVELAEEWLGRSGLLPLSISIRATFARPSPQAKMLVDLVGRYAGRISTLDLEVPEWMMQQFKEVGGISSNLTELEMRAYFGGWILDVGVSRCTPKIVRFDSLDLKASCIPWDRLTSITALQDISLCDVFQILKRAPRLQVGIFEQVGSGLSSAPEAILHVSLEELTLSGMITSFFLIATLPALRRLDCRADGFADLQDLRIPLLLLGSSCPLTELALGSCIITSNALLEIVRLTPSLTTLEIDIEIEARDLQPFFLALQTNSLPGQLLPNLEAFKCSAGPVFRWELLPLLFSPLQYGTSSIVHRPLKLIQVICNRYNDEYTGIDPIHYINEALLAQFDLFQLQTGIAYDFQDVLDRVERTNLLGRSLENAIDDTDAYYSKWIRYVED